MSHQVLSRKYRPQGFDELVGQEHVARILQNALVSGRVGHAYLFVGPRGVGKTTTARIFAKALNCQEPVERSTAPEPCGSCASCRDITAGIDLDVVEMDAASNNHVEDVRRLREQVGYATVRSRYRIWIVDEVHMLSLPAFNAFLKTLEEPPDGVKFLFCTTEEHKLPDTFRSRCQRVEFRPIGESSMAERLALLAQREGATMEEGLADEIASAALGGLRDAESLLEQLIAASADGRLARSDLDALAGRAPRERVEALRQAARSGDAAQALDALDACLAAGSKPGVLLDQWMEGLRADLLEAARAGRPVASLARAIDVLLEKRAHLRLGADGALVLQVAAVEVARLPDARDLDELLAALTRVPAAPGSPSPEPPPPRTAPRPADAGSAPAAGPGEGPDLARVRRDWDQLLAQTAARDGRLAQALARSRPQAVGEGRLHVTVPGDERMARSALERREAVLALRTLTRELWGQELALTVVVEDVSAAAPAAAPSPTDHPRIREVTEATGGRLVSVERQAPPPGGDRERPA